MLISPKILELFEGVFKSVLADEPGLLRYHLHQEVNSASGADELVMLET
jgi:quinol monooxygenase YgiN